MFFPDVNDEVLFPVGDGDNVVALAKVHQLDIRPRVRPWFLAFDGEGVVWGYVDRIMQINGVDV